MKSKLHVHPPFTIGNRINPHFVREGKKKWGGMVETQASNSRPSSHPSFPKLVADHTSTERHVAERGRKYLRSLSGLWPREWHGVRRGHGIPPSTPALSSDKACPDQRVPKVATLSRCRSVTGERQSARPAGSPISPVTPSSVCGSHEAAPGVKRIATPSSRQLKKMRIGCWNHPSYVNSCVNVYV